MGGNALTVLTEPDEARRLLMEALPLLEELGDVYGVGWALTSLGMLEAVQGDLGRGEALVLQAAEMFVRDGERGGEIVALQALGALAARRGDDITAVRSRPQPKPRRALSASSFRESGRSRIHSRPPPPGCHPRSRSGSGGSAWRWAQGRC